MLHTSAAAPAVVAAASSRRTRPRVTSNVPKPASTTKARVPGTGALSGTRATAAIAAAPKGGAEK